MLHGVGRFFRGKLLSVLAGELLLDFCRAHVYFLEIFGCGESIGLVVGFEVIYGVLGVLRRVFLISGEIVVDALLAQVQYSLVILGCGEGIGLVVGFEVVYGVLGGLGRVFILVGELLVDALLALVQNLRVVLRLGQSRLVIVRVRVGRGFRVLWGFLHLVQLL